MTPLCTLRRALSDPELLGNALPGDSWAAWRALLLAAMGEALRDDERALYQQLTGREREPGSRVRELVAVIGRRGGKSRALATLAVYLAALCDHTDVLAPGERGVLLIVAQGSRTARVILDYARAALEATPLLRKLVVASSSDAIELNNGVVLEVRWASYRALRGPTYVGALLDEAAFLWTDEVYANPDVEVVNALRPGLLTTAGPLIVASSPYARRGWLWDAYRRHYGANGDPAVLVAQAATRTMNPLVPAAWIDAELAKDPARNRAEYLAEFRSDVEGFVSLEVVEAAVGDYFELPRAAATRYVAFTDPAGGSGEDSFTVAVAHRDKRRPGDASAARIVVDAVRERRPPFSPSDVVAEFCALLKSYRVTRVTGDRFAGGFASEAFKQHGIKYEPAAKSKSEAYVDFLPLLNSGRVVLPRNDRLVAQLVGLERRTARGTGRDVVDHGPHGHDDVCNAVAGAALAAAKPSYDSSFDWVSGPDARDPETEHALAVEQFRRAQLHAHIFATAHRRRPLGF